MRLEQVAHRPASPAVRDVHEEDRHVAEMPYFTGRPGAAC